MPVFAEYVARETATNLWRNRLMTIAAVLTMATSLTLVGSALLLKQGAAKASLKWERGTQVSVFMQPDATAAQKQSVGTQLKGLPYVHSCTFWTKARSYAEAKRLLGPTAFSVLSPADMPTSYRCTPSKPADALLVMKQFKGYPGVYKVKAPVEQIHTMQKTVTVLQWVFIGIASVLLLSAAVLILNTIRMAIFARRREVAVMKLVGATNWFIRVPFMVEGTIQGMLGAFVAAGFVFLLHLLLNAWGNPAHPDAVLTQMRLSTWEVAATDLLVVFLGMVIGALGSALAIRRFLEV